MFSLSYLTVRIYLPVIFHVFPPFEDAAMNFTFSSKQTDIKPSSSLGISAQCSGSDWTVKLTGTFHALVYESIQQRSTVIAERGAGICVDLKCVSTLQVLE